MIKILFISLLTIAFTVCSVKSHAADVDFSWQIPTERVDGTALDISEISHYNLYYTESGQPTEVINVPNTASTHTQTIDQAGVYTAQISTVEATTLRESELSDPITFVVSEQQAAGVGKMTINFSWSCPEPCNLEISQ